jgi:hypothetical protein
MTSVLLDHESDYKYNASNNPQKRPRLAMIELVVRVVTAGIGRRLIARRLIGRRLTGSGISHSL